MKFIHCAVLFSFRRRTRVVCLVSSLESVPVATGYLANIDLQISMNSFLLALEQ